MKSKKIDELNIGDFGEFTKTITDSDIYLFAGVTGDQNPAHINEEYAKNTFFKTRIAHGILLAGFISASIAMDTPGPGSIYLKQDLKFKAPARIGDTITAKSEITDINVKRNRITMRTTCTNQDGTLLVDGEAIISPPK